MAQNLRGKISSGGSLHGTLSGLEKIQGYSAYQVAVINGFEGTEEEWLASLKGEQGIQGEPGKVVFEELTEEEKEMLKGNDGAPGKDGVSPAVSVQAIDGGQRVTITDADGETSFDLMDGADGRDGSSGSDGSDGVSPTVTVTAITGGHRVSITDANGTKTFDVMNGRDGASGSGTGDMLSNVYDPQGKRLDIFAYVDEKTKDIDVDVTADEVTFADGETFQQKFDSGELRGQDGEDGYTPVKNVDYFDGKDGQDGYTPQKGVDYFDGNDGSPGKDGTSVTVSSVSESTVDGGTNVVTFSDGKKLNVKNGSKGSDGSTGADGKTPVKGTDYFTEADKQEIAQAAAALVEVPDGFSGSWNDLTDKPSTFMPTAHNQAASTITAGTFAGQVVANSSGQTPGSYVLRYSKLSSTAEAPTVNGEICWKYK